MSCQTNPLQQLLSKKEQIETGSSFMSSVRGASHQQKLGQRHGFSPEQTFFTNQQGSSSSAFMTNDVSSAKFLRTPSSQRPNQPSNIHGNSEGTESWLPQFSSMKINDPLEFSSEYKNLYNNYEKRTQPSPYLQFSPSTHVSTRPQLFRRETTDYQHFKKLQLQSSFSAPIQEAANEDMVQLDSYFDLKFESLENELNELDDSLDSEQRELQKVASNIVESSSAPRSPGLRPKLASSKFIGLMRRISDGVVTVKKTENTLYSPVNGEIVGNEYFPIQNKVNDTKHLNASQ
ncbi:hypothetical protein KAFR_0B04330 [Kazachstania africana CBS 2517]|uniref:PEX18/PEX21 C-terminal domain-containing protein n=1 Tax=Kazachstania africana (strain ATCC 22294 / BCRC 22015 / CBS 2517 / CECT 1963 / NBRC 1671 / NRRL Y-8276) TaxID=1071382 RepID=H2AQS9_KAZAF|nr:hypothetical protein KAFR_0B04330 [Kazachstania africana CBS 2517]CCF56729.1 hypothetical protein KAFR_0B04330 [Kazachstania africana CBS 2517]